MAVAIADLKAGLDSLRLKYAEIDPENIGLTQVCENTQLMVVMRLEEDGEYLSMRTVSYATCPTSHPNVDAVMAELARANENYSIVGFGWDANDGEIAATVALPIEDNRELTHKQVALLYQLLIMSCDELYPRLKTLIEERASASPDGAPREGQRAGPNLLGIGVFLLGMAAVAGVLWLFLN